MKQTVKQVLAWLAILACSITLARADVPYAQDLQKDAEAARAVQGVVLLVFVGAHCSYCETALKEFLIPMSGNADYLSKVVMRQVESTGFRDLKDFQGRKVSHRKFAGENGARLTPTVMIFDGEGRQLAKPVVGVTTLDYYGVYLDQAIDQGVAKIRAKLDKLLPSGS
ncbi:MAG: thioredoxin family protein [Gammaproteobacteria bacterium]|nr:thioredoxin family protein [Gammaproteobacteria bacterium]